MKFSELKTVINRHTGRHDKIAVTIGLGTDAVIEAVPMPGSRKMYQAAVKALEAQKDMVSRKTANAAICNACGKIDCDQVNKCEKLFTTQEAAVKHGEIMPGDEVERYVDGRYDGRAMFLAEDGDRWTCLFGRDAAIQRCHTRSHSLDERASITA